MLFRTEAPDEIATLATILIEKWGLVAAMPDGEDTAGRAKLRLPTPDELVNRAFDIAAKTYEVARARGLLISVPDLNEINRESDALNQAALEKRAEKRAAERAA